MRDISFEINEINDDLSMTGKTNTAVVVNDNETVTQGHLIEP